MRQIRRPKRLNRGVRRPHRKTSFTPRAANQVEALLAEIGVPEKVPFKPDPFQNEAVRWIRQDDVLVSAPTGAGKTWIAEKAMAEILEKGGRAWYASPLKALSNAKYLEFGLGFGEENVGILTGDRKENSDAPIIVGTTEILRNQLYDAMSGGENLSSDLVVLDEAHYLADPDRGVVWEEVMIYLPARINLLLLSATLANADELADWLSQVRRRRCRVIKTEDRPVPLEPLFLSPDGEMWPLKINGQLAPRISHLLRQKDGLSQAIPLHNTLETLDQLDLLPAIFFMTSRSDCDQALTFSSGHMSARWEEKKELIEREIEAFLEIFPFVGGHHHLSIIRKYAVASHHAGHLPHFKLLVERLMQKGLLRAIFSTSTVAAGVNFPARTVVVSQSDRFNGKNFVNVSSTELTQMTGRAGRRGMDKVGFAVFPPGPHQNLPFLADLLDSEPEPIDSQMHLSFSMVLNLLSSHSVAEVKPLLSKSLASFLSAGVEDRPEFLQYLEETLTEGRCGEIEQAMILRRRHKESLTELDRLTDGWGEMQANLALKSLLTPGRVVADNRWRYWLVYNSRSREGRDGVMAAAVDGKGKMKAGRLRLKFLPISRIDHATKTLVEMKNDREMAAVIKSLAGRDHEPVDPEYMDRDEVDEEMDSAVRRRRELERSLSESPCRRCPLEKRCYSKSKNALGRKLNRAENWYQRLSESRERLWLGFLERLNFLIAEDFCHEDGVLTQEGHWAVKLRLDYPLVIAEAIRRDALPYEDPALFAALMAPFVLDRDRSWYTRNRRRGHDRELNAAFRELEEAISPLLDRLTDHHFRRPKMRYAPSLAMYYWAGGGDWDEIIRQFDLEEGDMASLILRTAENLRQLRSLKDTHPLLADSAALARDMILRPPVLVPMVPALD